MCTTYALLAYDADVHSWRTTRTRPRPAAGCSRESIRRSTSTIAIYCYYSATKPEGSAVVHLGVCPPVAFIKPPNYSPPPMTTSPVIPTHNIQQQQQQARAGLVLQVSSPVTGSNGEHVDVVSTVIRETTRLSDLTHAPPPRLQSN